MVATCHSQIKKIQQQQQNPCHFPTQDQRKKFTSLRRETEAEFSDTDGKIF